MKLAGHRNEQLDLLFAANAISRETAVAIAVDQSYRPVTLSRMVDEGLVEHEQLPISGDPQKLGAFYWLTAAGLRAIG